MKAKLQAILAQLNVGLVEREQVLKTTLLAVLAGENPVLIGPPGTGKSLMARRMADALAQDSSDYFEYLLTKFSTPEEIFGPLSISELKADRFKRNTAGYLPTVKLAFLDEIFKASSSILNALLTILNERIYHNGAEPQRVPLQALIAASNELPSDQEELSALYDRFLVRVFVDYVSEAGLPHLFETTTEPQWSAETQLQGHELQRIREGAHAVQLPPEIAQAIQRIWALHRETFKEDRRESLSDRRLKKIIYLLRVSAATNGRREVDLSDVLLLKDCLWNHPDNAVKVRELVLKTLQGFSRQVPCEGPLTALEDGRPFYDLSEDGRTLIPVQTRTGAIEPLTTAITMRSNTKQAAALKGFKGNGSVQDPILIETAEDLAHLESAKIGQQGYYFRQTADIDISEFSTWPSINFKGFYDGNGFLITDDVGHRENIENETIDIFIAILESEIINLRINNCNLAKEVRLSKLIACESTASLISSYATHSSFTKCKTIYSIAYKATDCTITSCFAKNPLIRNIADHCTIIDCQVILDGASKREERYGGIASFLKNQSLVERCIVSGEWECNGYSHSISGITQKCDASKIHHCAIGELSMNNSSNFNRGIDNKLYGRIAGEILGDSYLDGNISIDENAITKFHDGKSVSSALFKRRYFENVLYWDFINIWAWDEENNQPTLCKVGVGSITNSNESTAIHVPTNPTADLLMLQIRANLWL